MSERLNSDEMFIVKRMIDGDKQAFKYFFEKYYTELCNFAYIYLRDKDLAEEVVQDIFVYFWENKSKIHIKSSVRSYLFGASKYRSMNVLREQKNLHLFHDTILDDGNMVVETSTDYFEDVDAFKKILEEAIQQLPEKCKQIFLLGKREELSNKEIARQLNVSVKTIENQMTIALKKIRVYLLPYRGKIFLIFLICFLNS